MRLIHPAFAVLSFVLIVLSGLMAIPAVYALLFEPSQTHCYLIAFIITFTSALLLRVIFHGRVEHLHPRAMVLITVVNWVAVSLYSAIPFKLCIPGISYVDAIFEAVSGVTTTGSTVLTDLDHLPPELLLWRSITQWLGGLGIIGLAVTVLPFLKVGGMRLFKTESSDWSDKALPKTSQWLKAIILTYLVLSIFCSIAYWLAGMSWFEAINHAMTTISTGGFSTSDRSMGHFNSPAVHWVGILFMLIGSIPFTLFVMAWYRNRIRLESQITAYFYTLLMCSIVMAAYLYLERGFNPLGAFTTAAFNITSVASTTGFASTDYTLWGPVAICFFYLLTCLGGCSGSTAGGIKVFRYQLLYMLMKSQLTRTVHPRSVQMLKYNGKKVTGEIFTDLTSYLFLVILTFAVLSLILAFSGLDLETSLSGSATALMNVGPGLGEVIGPSGNFLGLSDLAKWALCAGMLLGRLEFVAFVVIFSPAYWRG